MNVVIKERAAEELLKEIEASFAHTKKQHGG